MTDAQFAAAALESAQASRNQLADKMRCPVYMHAIFGAMLGGLVASEAASDKGTLIIEGLIAVAALVYFVLGRRRLGFFVNGYRRGRTRPIALTLAGIYLVLFSLAAALKGSYGLHWPALALGALMFAIGTYGGYVWQKTYRAELLGEGGHR